MSSDDPKVTAAPATRPKQRRMRDMALSLAVLLVPLAIFLVIWNWAASDREVTVADTAEDYGVAESLGLDVIRPELSDDWKPISSAVASTGDTVTLRTGWYSPDGNGLQLIQTTGEPKAVNDHIEGAGEPVSAGGIDWKSYDIPEGRAWVAEIDGATVILTAEPDAEEDLPDLAEGVAESL